MQLRAVYRNSEPICAYRNENMNHMRALIMTRRKMTPITTQITINVIFERRKEVEFGNKSKLFNKVTHLNHIEIIHCLHCL